MAKLTFLLDDGQEIVVAVADATTIGRVDGNDVVVDDPRISAKHASISRSAEGQYEVHDLGSKAGTFWNGEKVKRHVLSDGDQVGFGPLQGRFNLDPAELVPVVKKAKKRVSTKAAKLPAAAPAASQVPALTEGPDKKLLERLEALQKEITASEAGLQERKKELQAAQLGLGEETGKLASLREESAAAVMQLKELNSQMDMLKKQIIGKQQQLKDATDELQEKIHRVEKLPEEEKKLEALLVEFATAEKRQEDLKTSLSKLEQVYEQKHQVAGELLTEISTYKGEIKQLEEAKLEAQGQLSDLQAKLEASQQEQATLLQEREKLQASLDEKNVELTVVTEKTVTMLSLVEARQDQSKALEKSLSVLEQQREHLEARLEELSGTEEKLKATSLQLSEAETRHSALSAALLSLAASQKVTETREKEVAARVATLQSELEATEGKLTATQASFVEAEKALAEFQALSGTKREEAEAVLTKLTEKIEVKRQEVQLKKEEITAETAKLADLQSQRAELERQCNELADTGLKLENVTAELKNAETQRAELLSLMETLQLQKTELSNSIESLQHEQEVSQGKIEVLRGRENDLRAELDSLSEREQQQRERFEEISKLSVDADKEHAEQKERLARSLDLSRRELADMELKLTPLKRWKEDMDKRYDRLAALPEDSNEARLLWKEIEAEKANLSSLITKRDGNTRSITLSEAVLRGLSAGDESEHAEPVEPAKPARGKGKLHAPQGVIDATTPGERGNVGQTGTGAMLSGTGQEMSLKARVTRLRESVQREATRLEFLRQERAREETRTKVGAGGEAMLREQDRQLESKVRREEERLATMMRKLELAEMEEEKRREKIAELERKLSEIKSDIADAERDRSDARHQAEIAQAELRSSEEAVERAKRGNLSEYGVTEKLATGGGVLASIVNSTKSRSQLNLKSLGTTKES
jgi:chromosome segregation ATPase